MCVELEAIIDDMGDAMRKANLRYVAENDGQRTPHMDMAWNRFVTLAYRYKDLT